MEEPTGNKGTVTSLASLFSPEETKKASERVQNGILERRRHLDQLKEFIADNANLINIVQTLLNELHHDIMVPFGKAAFFPGKLIHTNEFMVLLGEGFYTERTSKQTVEILKRRGKTLDSQVESLKAEIQDLKVEASFFDATAAEAKDGLVQIVEDCVEEASTPDVPEPGKPEADSSRSFKDENSGTTAEDEEFERIFFRIAELEKEEEEAEKASEDEEDEQDEDGLGPSIDQLSLSQEVKSSEVDVSNLSVHKGETCRRTIDSIIERHCINANSDSSHSKAPALNKPNLREKAQELPRIEETVQASAISEKEVIGRPVEPLEPDNNSKKAFTGSIVEHTQNLESNQMEQSSARGSKPVSRFKWQRR